MTNVWAELEALSPYQNASPISTPPACPASPVDFPEWDAGGFPKPRLPTGLILKTNTAIERTKTQPSITDIQANTELFEYLRDKPEAWRQNGLLIQNYFISRPDLIARLAMVRVGLNRLTDRLNEEFKVSFMPNEVGRLGSLVPISGAQNSNSSTDMSKAARAALRNQALLAQRVERARKEAERNAELKRLFEKLCAEVVGSEDPKSIVDFACQDPNFEKLLGVNIAKMISDFTNENPPPLIWTPGAAYTLSPAIQDGVAAICIDLWHNARHAHLQAIKRSASALKAAETRRARNAEKRLIAEAEAKIRALQARQEALPIALTARTAGPEALIALLADNEAARSLLQSAEGEDSPPLILTKDEIAAQQRRNQALLDAKGIWRKDVQQQCPWLKDAEIERLYKSGHLKVLRTVEIKKQGRWINARLYDPASVRRLTLEWVKQWRHARKSQNIEEDGNHSLADPAASEIEKNDQLAD